MRVITGILAVLALMLSGCSDTADPTTLPTQSIPTVATPATSPTPPSPSPAARLGESNRGNPTRSTWRFCALVEDYFEAANEASQHQVLDDALDRRETLFGASCSVCQDGADTARAILDSGLTVEGGSVAHTAKVLRYENDIALVQVSHQIGAIRLLDADGDQVDSAPASDPIDQVFQIARQENGQWLVLSVQTCPEAACRGVRCRGSRWSGLVHSRRGVRDLP